MAEYTRTTTHQFCDTELVQVMDSVTGELEPFYRGRYLGPLSEALTYCKKRRAPPKYPARLVIIKLQAIKGFPHSTGEPNR